MGILLACHSTGDTENIIDTVKLVVKAVKEAKETGEKIYVLTVGKNATSIVGNSVKEFPNVSHLSLSDIIGEEEAKGVENSALSPQQLSKVQECLAKLEIDTALIGNPSENNAAAPFQIAELISDRLEFGMIYNEYLFEESEHIFYKTLQQKKPWQKKFAWMLATQQAELSAKRANPEIKTAAVGHRAIDAATQPHAFDQKEISDTRNKLKLSDKQSLLFISATKNAEDDKKLLEQLLSCIQDNKSYSNIEIRLGIHPGLKADPIKLNNYVLTLAEVITKYAGTPVANQVKFIITKELEPLVDLSKIPSTLICATHNVTGDQAALAAQGVACAVPATLINKAALSGKPAYYHQDSKTPFLPGERLHAGVSTMGLFLNKVAGKEMLGPVDKAELKLESQPVAQTLANMLIRKNR